MEPDESSLESHRAEIAMACRILATQRVLDGVLGHVSLRVDEKHMLLRCRGPAERGLIFSEAHDIGLVDLKGVGLDLPSGYRVPYEHPIHGELYRRRPQVQAVVHAHPTSALLAGLAGLRLRPIFGAYNIPAMHLAQDGIPVYQRPVLISSADLAQELLTAMGTRPVCLLRGHGIVAVGKSLPEAVMNAVNLEGLCQVTVQLAQMGVEAAEVSASDQEELPDLGRSFNDDMAYRHLQMLHDKNRSRH